MKDRLLSAFLAGTIDDITLQNKTAEIELEKKQLTDSLAERHYGQKMSVIDLYLPENVRNLVRDYGQNDRSLRTKDARIDAILSLFDFSQMIEHIWRGSNFAQKRQILEIVSLNRNVSDVSLCITKNKPFEILQNQRAFQSSRKD